MPGYTTDCRFFQDIPDVTNIHWYQVPRDRPCLPFASFVEDSDWTNNNGPKATIFKGNAPDIQGEQWVDRPATRIPPRPAQAFSGHFCGNEEQWAGNLVSTRQGDLGSLTCCNPEDFGEFNCDFSVDFDNRGPCP